MVKFFKRRKLFDEDADWVPQKGMQFKMKTEHHSFYPEGRKPTGEEPPQEEPPMGPPQEEPPREEPFRMKAEPPDRNYELPKKKIMKEPAKTQDKIKTDAEGMDRAYARGDLYGEGNKMYVARSHSRRDWFDDVTKIP